MQETYRGLDLGLGPVENDAWLHQRVQLLLEAERPGTITLASEFTWGQMWGKQPPLAPPDEDEGDLLQLHVEAPLWRDSNASLLLKVGRQILSYGSGRLLAAREGANQRLSHDALLLSWEQQNAFKLDAFVASPVEVEPGAFDNRSHPDRIRFWSVYAVLVSPWAAGHHLDLYYIGLRDHDSIFTQPGSGAETRHTLGARLWHENGPLLYNTELMLQFGHAGERDILAGAASLGAGWEFARTSWKPVLQLRADLISGGGDRDTLHTFHPLFQANNYFNEGGFFSPSNLWNLNPLITFHPHDAVEVSVGVNFLWRFSATDGIYAPPLQELVGASPDGSRYLGTAFNAAVTWHVRQGQQFFLGYTHHGAGPSLKAAGGTDEDYFQAGIRFEF